MVFLILTTIITTEVYFNKMSVLRMLENTENFECNINLNVIN